MSRLSKVPEDERPAESAPPDGRVSAGAPSPQGAGSLRAVILNREDIRAIEAAAHAQITAGKAREGFQLLGRCLDWRYRSGIGGEPEVPPEPPNVVELHGYSKKVLCE